MKAGHTHKQAEPAPHFWPEPYAMRQSVADCVSARDGVGPAWRKVSGQPGGRQGAHSENTVPQRLP